jgi:large subunit ribosomal protein L4
MQVPVYSIEGKEVGKIELLADVFEAPIHQHAVYLAVKQYLANQRQGTHKTKTRGEVAGSTKKPWKQKGTGGARAGHKRSPLWRHGGTVFGPQPRDYSQKLNDKVKKLARRSALSAKLKDNDILVLQDFSFNAPKTKSFFQILRNLGIQDHKVLFVLTNNDSKDSVYLSGRNIPNVELNRVWDLNTYQIMNCDKLVIIESAVEQINQKF